MYSETETLYQADWSEWVECPDCGGDKVGIVHRSAGPSAESCYLWCEDCGRFHGQGPGIEGEYIGEDPDELEYGRGHVVGETHFKKLEGS